MDLESGLLPTSYVKNEGGTLTINKLHTVNTSLATEDIKSAISSVLNGDGISSAIAPVFSALSGTKLAVGNLEFRNTRYNYTNDQAFYIKDAVLDKYSILRVHESSDYKDNPNQSTKVTFDNLTMKNITGVAFGVGLYAKDDPTGLFGTDQVASPDEIVINNLHVQHGGTDIDYAALLSSDNTSVKVGTINIDDNTLDLAGSTISIVGNDVKEYLNENYQGNDTVKKVIDFLDHYADEADFRLQQGKLDDKALEFLKGHTGKLAELLGNESLQGTLDSLLGQLGPSIIDTTLTGVILQALDGSDTVTVNMTMKDPGLYARSAHCFR